MFYFRYYHGPISHSHVVSLLDRCEQIGTFLVRDSETNPGEYVLCIKSLNDIANVKIKYIKGYLYLDGKTQREPIDRFKSLDELIHFYVKHNILIDVNQTTFRLEQTCTAHWFYAGDIHQRCEYLSRTISTAADSKTGFKLEFEWVNRQSELQSTAFHRTNGEKQENRIRNRFRNILPYDETRVILRNYSTTDYINANRIRSPFDSVRREYIATQGPLPTTINDFWHMVQQECVTCIVMITREIENSRVRISYI
jgi:tyrosine-protein phosphatase non-receptor type 11